MAVNLAVAGGCVTRFDRSVAALAIRLTDSEGDLAIAAIKGAPKRLKIVSAVEPKAHHARA